jgi:adenylate kinase
MAAKIPSLPAVFSLAVSGTPCTGKTTVSTEIGKRLKAVVLDLNDYAVLKTQVELDEERNTLSVDVDELKKAFKEDYRSLDTRLVVDGLLSHLMPVSHVLVLRADPRLLLERMMGRGYSKAKIKENLEAEYAGVILYDAVSLHKNVLELDATDGVDYEDIEKWIRSGGRTIVEEDWSYELTEALKAVYS